MFMDISYKSEPLTVKKQVMSNATSLDITKTMVLASRWHATADVDLFMCVLLCLVVQMTDLQTGNLQMVAALPIGKYIVGENAYVCLEHLLTPFSGKQRNDAMKDSTITLSVSFESGLSRHLAI